MNREPPATVRLPFMLALNAYWFGLSFMWNSLHVIILPAMLLNFVPENYKNTYLGLLTFFGLIIAMIVQPISGSFSDRWQSRWGRRRPLILAGTLFDFIFLALLGWAGGLVWLAVGYIGLQFSSNVAHGPAQGLLPDLVPPKQLGAASAIKNLMDMAGLVVSSLLVGRLLDPNARDALGPMAWVAGTLALGLLITVIFVRERSSLGATLPASAPAVVDAPQPAAPANLRPYWWLIAARFAFLLGIYDIQVFAQYYVRDVIAVENPVQLTGDLLAAITLALIAAALGGGWLGDRFGHRRVMYLAAAVGAVGCGLLLAARTPTTLLVFGAVLGVGIGLFLTSNWAMLNTLAPANQAGKYIGLTNLATAGAGAVGRLGGPLIDLGNNAAPGQWAGYVGMFLLGVICSLASAVLLWIAGRQSAK